MFFGHPLVPAVEHLQPFCLPLPQHLNGNYFSAVEIGDNATDKIKNTLFSCKLTMATLYCLPSLKWTTRESCHQRGRDCGSSLPCPHRKPNLRHNSGTLANSSKVQGKQEAVGELSPCSVPYNLLHKTYNSISLHYSPFEDQSCHVVIHTLYCPGLPNTCLVFLVNKFKQTSLKSWLACFCIQ